MDTIDAIITRRSIRNFKDQGVPQEVIDKIMECALAAPSAKNSNPWYFLILKGKEKEEITGWMREAVDKGKITAPIDNETGKPNTTWFDSTLQSAIIIEKAPVIILVFNRSPFTGGRKTLSSRYNDRAMLIYIDEIIGIGCAIENILLAAHALGLSAVCIADIDPAEKKIQHKYKIDYELLAAIPIGYPTYSLSKRKLNEGLVKIIGG